MIMILIMALNFLYEIFGPQEGEMMPISRVEKQHHEYELYADEYSIMDDWMDAQ